MRVFFKRVATMSVGAPVTLCIPGFLIPGIISKFKTALVSKFFIFFLGNFTVVAKQL